MYPQQFPQQPAAPQYPQAPQFPQQPQGYPAPAYPVAPPAPQYPQQGYPQQGYPQQYAPPAPPAPPLPTGTLDSFYEQPSAGGGPSLKFMDANRNPQIGKSYTGIVARPVTNADVRAQVGNNGQPSTFKDGRPKFVLVVPLQMQPSEEFPDGQAGWWVKGQARDELARAMAEAGAPAGPPEAGAAIRVTLMSIRPVPNMSPAFQFRVEYVRPQGAAPVPAQPAVALAQPASVLVSDAVYAPAPAPQGYGAQPASVLVSDAVYAPAPAPQGYGAQPFGPQPTPAQVAAFEHQAARPMPQPAYVPGMEGHPIPALNIGATVTPPMVPQMAPQPVAQPAQAAPPGFSEEQARLFAKLTGGSQG